LRRAPGGGGYGNMNTDDIFSQFGDIFGDDMFGSFSAVAEDVVAEAAARARGQRGANLRIKLKLNFEEIAKGVTKNVKVKKHVVCTTCGGNGAKDKTAYKPAAPVTAAGR
jgi:molecular chaperone DnaJ